eukprot:m.33857 g.33857  ORF g.33857 m.33857 type:complete len:262 (+) comp8615_c0_seq1:230-1015(+)
MSSRVNLLVLLLLFVHWNLSVGVFMESVAILVPLVTDFSKHDNNIKSAPIAAAGASLMSLYRHHQELLRINVYIGVVYGTDNQSQTDKLHDHLRGRFFFAKQNVTIITHDSGDGLINKMTTTAYTDSNDFFVLMREETMITCSSWIQDLITNFKNAKPPGYGASALLANVDEKDLAVEKDYFEKYKQELKTAIVMVTRIHVEIYNFSFFTENSWKTGFTTDIRGILWLREVYGSAYREMQLKCSTDLRAIKHYEQDIDFKQ